MSEREYGVLRRENEQLRRAIRWVMRESGTKVERAEEGFMISTPDEYPSRVPLHKTGLAALVVSAMEGDQPEWVRLGFRSVEQMAETMAEDELDRQRSRAGEGPWREE